MYTVVCFKKKWLCLALTDLHQNNPQLLDLVLEFSQDSKMLWTLVFLPVVELEIVPDAVTFTLRDNDLPLLQAHGTFISFVKNWFDVETLESHHTFLESKFSLLIAQLCWFSCHQTVLWQDDVLVLGYETIYTHADTPQDITAVTFYVFLAVLEHFYDVTFIVKCG